MDSDPEIRPGPGQFAGTGGVLLATTDKWSAAHVPSADQYPRRDAGRKGAYRRRKRWRQRHPCPPSPRRAQRPGRGNETGAGRAAISPCPLRALQGRLLRSSRLITVNRNRCSAALSWPSHVVPKLVILCTGGLRQAGSGWRSLGLEMGSSMARVPVCALSYLAADRTQRASGNLGSCSSRARCHGYSRGTTDNNGKNVTDRVRKDFAAHSRS